MNVHVDSVDCGGRQSSFARTVVQLWNGTSSDDPFLKASKVKAIFDRVDGMRPLLAGEPIFFEWGDEHTPTSTYAVDRTTSTPDSVDVYLSVPPTLCKPTAELGLECCPPQKSSVDVLEAGACCA
ncbi:MAG: hypothetical protein HKN13_13270 [Rhodothermales bacterium]|nr:hypothetical protein [Rhodothermales bacterium]